jgi:hypothetical protein
MARIDALLRPTVRSRTSDTVLQSVIAGQLGGLVMAVVLMAVFGLFLRHTIFYPVQVIAAFFLGTGALDHLTAGNFIVGVLGHQLGPSLFWSLIFAWVVASSKTRFTLGESMLLGFFVGGLAEIIDVYILMPPLQAAVNGYNVWAINVPKFWDWIAHLVYGVALGYFYAVLREPLHLPRRAAQGR